MSALSWLIVVFMAFLACKATILAFMVKEATDHGETRQAGQLGMAVTVDVLLLLALGAVLRWV